MVVIQSFVRRARASRFCAMAAATVYAFCYTCGDYRPEKHTCVTN